MFKNYPNVYVYDSSETLAATVAHQFVEFINKKQQSSQKTTKVAITGGSIGIATLAKLALEPNIDKLLGQVLWFWGDERFLPATDKDRNSQQAEVAFFNKVSLPKSNIFPFPANEGKYLDRPEIAAETYANTIARNFDNPLIDSFDLQLLGMGPDGHINSLFPKHDSLEITDSLVLVENNSPKPPPVRLTLSLPVTNAAKEIWLVVAGKEKSNIIKEIIVDNNISLPAGRLAKQKVTWFLDQSAASLI